MDDYKKERIYNNNAQRYRNEMMCSRKVQPKYFCVANVLPFCCDMFTFSHAVCKL